MNGESYQAPPIVRKAQWSALTVGVLTLLLCLVWAPYNPQQFFRSYLVGYIFWCGLSLGCMGILLLNHVAGGLWGIVPRPILEAAARTLPVLVLLFVPIALGLRWIYPWAQPSAAVGGELLIHKHTYLNAPFFLLRSGLFFAFATSLAYLLSEWSQRLRTGSPDRWLQRLRTVSAPCLFVLGLLTSFAFIDWVMTLVPAWYSTIFGLVIVSGQALAAFAFVIVVLVLLSDYPPLSGAVSAKVLHDLGKLMQAFVLLWAYMGFCQLLIVWAGNLPHEILWYVPRLNTTWRRLGELLIIGQFALPFFLLLFRRLKRRRQTLGALAVWVLAMRYFDQLWLIEPDFHPEGLRVHMLDLLLPIAIGGVWLAEFCWLLRRRPILPLGDPALEPSLALARQEPPEDDAELAASLGGGPP
jgi:hypothetical protein